MFIDIFDDIRDARRILREIKLLMHFDKHPDIVKYANISKVPTILWSNHKIEGVSSFKLKRLLKSFDQR